MDRWEGSFRIRVTLLLGCLAATVFFFGSLDWKTRFATDVSILLPDAGVDDAAARLLAETRERNERMVLGALLPPERGWGGSREAAAEFLLQHLRDSERFAKVAEGAGPSDPDALAAAVYEGRLDLLLPQWAETAGLSLSEPDPARWAEAIVESLEYFLVSPEAAALAELIPGDPFPLAAYMADTAPVAMDADEAGPVLFWAIQTESPFTRSGQGPVLATLAEAEEAAAERLPGTALLHASVAAFAVESERRIRREITVLNLFGVLLVGLVAFIFLRKQAMMMHLAAIAALSIAGGMAAVVLTFPVVHVLSLVVGALLVGVAVDYGIHILLHRPEDPKTGFAGTLREVRKPLLASALSTAAGFVALTFTDLLLLRQIGVFVAGGLVCALAASWIYFPLWIRPAEAARFSAPKTKGAIPRPVVAAAVVIFLLPLAGWLRLDWRDDLRDLQPSMPERREQDTAVRQYFSQGESYIGWLCPGDSPLTARSLLARFSEQWREAGGAEEDLLSLARWVAEPEKRDAVRATFAEMAGFEKTLRKHLAESGFEADEFAPFFSELRKWLSDSNPDYEYRLASLAAALDGPSGILLRKGNDGWRFFVSASAEAVPDGWEAPAGVVPAAQLETLNELFADYRKAAWRIGGVALLAIAAGVSIAFGPAAGALGLLLPALAWTWGMGAVTWLFSPLNLFHLIGGFLGFCVVLDYGLFFRHARAKERGLPLSIRLSAATTLSAFGVLAFGSIPAVAALGASVFAVVLGGLFLVEIAAVLPSKKRRR